MWLFGVYVFFLRCWLFVVDFKEMSFKKVFNVFGFFVFFVFFKVSVIGGFGVYVISNSLYNVEGGYCVVMFNCLIGIKEKVLYYFFS